MPEPTGQDNDKRGIIKKIIAWTIFLFKKKESVEGGDKKNKVKRVKKSFETVNEKEIKKDLDISLMPETAIVIPRIIRSKILFLIASLIVISTAFLVIWTYANWHFEKIKTQVDQAEQEIEFLETKTSSFLEERDELKKMEERAVLVEDILAKHIYWTKFFALLENYTIPDVYFSDFGADTSGIIHLDASGKNLLSIAKQIVAFNQAADFVKEVRVSGVAKSGEFIKAGFDLVLVDNVFYK
jgi:hypothetical protein